MENTTVSIAAGIASTPAPATILADYRRGVGRIRTAPDKFLGCAAGIKLTAHEAWTIGWAIQHEFGGVLGTTSPADHLGRVWEEADRLEREGREVTVLTVWAAVQSKIRTRDVRDMANALDVPRLRKNRKTAAEAAKLLAMQPLRFGSANHDGWTPGSLLEEHLEVEGPFPAPDKAFSAWERYFYSEDDAHALLVRILQDTRGAHPGAALLLEVMDYRIEQGHAQTKTGMVHAVGKVAQRHGLKTRAVQATITEFIKSLGGNSAAGLKALRTRGKYATKSPA